MLLREIFKCSKYCKFDKGVISEILLSFIYKYFKNGAFDRGDISLRLLPAILRLFKFGIFSTKEMSLILLYPSPMYSSLVKFANGDASIILFESKLTLRKFED